METTIQCWVGTAGKGYPRFEAWDSAGPLNRSWFLRIINNPGAEPIEVSGLNSLGEARQFASGMLTGLSGGNSSKFAVESYDRTIENVPCLAGR